MVYGTMVQIKRASKIYSQRFESASGFETDPYLNRMIPPDKNPADGDFWESMQAAWLDPMDDDWDSEDLTPLSGEDLWQALVGPEPVAQSRKQRRNSRKKRSRRTRTAPEDIVSVQNPAALLAAWVGYEESEPSPPQAALPAEKPVAVRSANRTPVASESLPHAHGGAQLPQSSYAFEGAQLPPMPQAHREAQSLLPPHAQKAAPLPQPSL